MSWQNILKVNVDEIDQNTKKLIVEEYNRNMKNDIKTKLESKIAEGKIPKISIVVSGKQADNQMKDGITGTTYIIGTLSHGAMDGANKNVIMQQISPLLNADGYQTSESKLNRGTMTVQLPPEKVKQVKANNPTMMRNLSSKVSNILSRKPKATGQQPQQPATSTALATTGQQQPIDVEFTETDNEDDNPNVNPRALLQQNKNRKRLLGQGQ